MAVDHDDPPATSSWAGHRLAPSRLDASSFSFVMATGIVATAARLHGMVRLSDALVVVAAFAWVGLVLLLVAKVVRHPRAVVADLRNPQRSFGHFTLAAGTDVLAACLLPFGHARVALVLLALAAAAWLVLGYLVPWAVLTTRSRPALAAASGAWFLWVVASESVAVAAAGLERVPGPFHAELAVLAVLTWSIGLVLYPVTAMLLLLRLIAHRPTAREVNPSYWIAMGALAITVFAGARIVEMDNTPIVQAARGIVAGIAVVLWSFASWLVPPLVAAGLWRHGVRRVPLRYEPTWWSMVFPLGMYAVAAMHLATADGLPFVARIGSAWTWVALATWALVLASMLVAAARRRTDPRVVSPSRR